jgi:hypothetical protein
MPPIRRKSLKPPEPPGFEVCRELPVGRHPILAAFPRLGDLDPARRLEPDGTARTKLFDETCVEIVEEDVWMYVAPFRVPKGAPRRWRPHTSPGSDCVVIGAEHLHESPALVLYLDIYHELCHVRQRHAGQELFDRAESYVHRPTEVEAYRFAVDEARRLGASDEFLRDYLRVEWVTDAELLELFQAVGVPPATA